MTEVNKKWIREQERFKGIFDGNVYQEASIKIVPDLVIALHLDGTITRAGSLKEH